MITKTIIMVVFITMIGSLTRDEDASSIPLVMRPSHKVNNMVLFVETRRVSLDEKTRGSNNQERCGW